MVVDTNNFKDPLAPRPVAMGSEAAVAAAVLAAAAGQAAGVGSDTAGAGSGVATAHGRVGSAARLFPKTKGHPDDSELPCMATEKAQASAAMANQRKHQGKRRRSPGRRGLVGANVQYCKQN